MRRPGGFYKHAHQIGVCMALSIMLFMASLPARAQLPPFDIPDVDEEDRVEAAAILALGTTLVVSTKLGFSVDPFTSFAADNVAFASNLALKFIRAPLSAPPDRSFSPRTSLRDPVTGVNESDCLHTFDLPQSFYSKEDIFGVNISNALRGSGPGTGIPTDWGDLGTPDVIHYNTQVILTANNRFIVESDREQTVNLPAGTHQVEWRADTMYDIVFDALLPAALVAASGYGKYKRGEFALADPKGVDKLAKATRARQLAGKGFIEKLGIKAVDACTTRPEKCVKLAYKGISPTADYFTDFEIVAATTRKEQIITVFDLHDPTLDIKEPELVVEATDIGGTFVQRIFDQTIRPSVEADDSCGRPVSLGNDLPTLLPVGPTDVTWTATDLGPAPTGGRNSVTASQRIIVQDTQPPIIVPPPSRVIEVDPADTDGSDGIDAEGVNPAVVNLGVPRVVDLADPSPTISTNAPEFFPVNSRTEVLWSATDKGFPSPNTSTATQLITVKLKGTNTAPTVQNISTSTLTSDPVDIRLTGLDNDVLDGRLDPVAMTIVDRPQNGEFVAPLLPYFIEDFRTSPAGPYGDAFFLSNNRGKWLYDNVCRVPSSIPNGERIRRDWVYVPRFVQVTDDGTYFMIDTYWKCSASDATGGGPRISKWDRDGNYLGQIDYGGTTDAFVMDQDGSIYTLTKQGAGSSTTLSLSQISPDFDTNSSFRGDLWKFDFASTGDDPVSNNQYSYARVDSQRGLIYVNDRRRIFVYDVRADLADPERNSRNGMGDLYLGALNNGNQVFACTSFGSSWSGFAMEVDSEGNLYVADTCGDRIHKFTATTFDEEGVAQLGEYVGWMGRCDSSTNKACDEDTGTSKGYSCTDQTCSVSQTEGPEPGQFSTPVYLAIDPNDILYVADSANSRIQRFSPDGTFAGQAQSTGTGINRGDNPSFVLGNMGNPKAVSVNSSQFFVVDQEESFINVFETTPLKDITDDGATVTYVSNFDFHSDVDSFTYRAGDGLAESNLGRVDIRVNRNFRAPIAESFTVSTDEDRAVNVTLLADDPDGIIGRDFNGLDTLTYEIVEAPANGRLTGNAPNLRYIPDPDFFGEDSFIYRADDSRLRSEPAEVSIKIAAVNDPVQLTDTIWPTRVGRGFPALLSSEFSDDGGSPYTPFVDWGDGGIDVLGDFVDSDGEDGPLPPQLNGVKLVEPPQRVGDGVAIADHTFNNNGRYAARFCISDSLANVCSNASLEVEDLAKLSMTLDPGEASTTADSFQLTLTVANTTPEGWEGLAARNLEIELAEQAGVRVIAAQGNSGGAQCSVANGGVSCSASNLAVGASLDISLTVQPELPAIFDTQIAPVLLRLTTSTEALEPEYFASNPVQFEVDGTDSDNDGMSDRFEEFYGLNANSAADANADPDRDGLSNKDEFDARTDPGDRDTDGDGAGDGVDPDPLNPEIFGTSTDLNGDGATDAADILLLQQALQDEPVSITLDLNEDGLTNAADLLLLQQRVGAP